MKQSPEQQATPGPRVVVTHRVHEEVAELLSASCDLVINDSTEPWDHDGLIERASEADALLVFMPDRIDRALIDACPRLRIVAGALKGHDNIDIEACTRSGVWVTNVPDLLTEPTAELAIALLLGLIRNVADGDRLVRGGDFNGWRPALFGATLTNHTVGILGMGSIGQGIARRLRGFGCRILYHDPDPLPPVEEASLRVIPRQLEALLAESDFLIAAAPLTQESHHLLNGKTLCRLKPGTFIVNVGRGSVVDERAIVALLADGHIAGYATDVYEMEDQSLPARPACVPSGLIDQPERTLLTPHLGSAVDEVRRRIEESAARSIIDVLEGREPHNAVNRVAETIESQD